MTTTTRTPLTPTSVGVAEFTADRQRFGPIHEADTDRAPEGKRNRYPYPITCGPRLKLALPVHFAAQDSKADDWCPDCWATGEGRAHEVVVKPGPFSVIGRRGMPVCSTCGPLAHGHRDYADAKDIAAEHVRVTGEGQAMSAHLSFKLTTAQLINANHRQHWAAKAEKTRYLRTLAATKARGQRVGSTVAVLHIDIEWPDRRRRDGENLAPTIKACLDGAIQDAGLLPDDDDLHIIERVWRSKAGNHRGITHIDLRLFPRLQEVGGDE